VTLLPHCVNFCQNNSMTKLIELIQNIYLSAMCIEHR